MMLLPLLNEMVPFSFQVRHAWPNQTSYLISKRKKYWIKLSFFIKSLLPNLKKKNLLLSTAVNILVFSLQFYFTDTAQSFHRYLMLIQQFKCTNNIISKTLNCLIELEVVQNNCLLSVQVTSQEKVTLTLTFTFALIVMGTEEERAPQARVESLISSQKIFQQKTRQREQQPAAAHQWTW